MENVNIQLKLKESLSENIFYYITQDNIVNKAIY